MGKDTKTGKVLHLEDAQRLTHTLITGKSGTGKTMLMACMLLQDLLRGANVVLLDLIGTLAPYLMQALASILLVSLARARGFSPALARRHHQELKAFFGRIELMMLGETSAQHIRFNPLEPVPGLSTSEVASAFAAAMERILDGEMSQMRALLLNLTALGSVLIDSGGAIVEDMGELCCMETRTLQEYLRLLEKKRSIGKIRRPLRPDLVQRYMSAFFAQTAHRDRRDLTSSTLRALNLILSDPIAKRLLSSPRGNLHLRGLMDGGGSMLVSIPPLNLHTQAVIGGFILGQVSSIALRRSSMAVSRGELPQVHLVIDEFQRIFTSEMAQNIAVYRNKGVALTLAHQSSSQPPFHTPEGAAMLQSSRDNCSNKITPRVGPKDAQELAREYFMPKGHTLKRDEMELLHRAQLTRQESAQRSQEQGEGWEQSRNQTQLDEQQQERRREQKTTSTRSHQTQRSQEYSRDAQTRQSHEFGVGHVQARARQVEAQQQRSQATRQTQTAGDRQEVSQQNSRQMGQQHGHSQEDGSRAPGLATRDSHSHSHAQMESDAKRQSTQIDHSRSQGESRAATKSERQTNSTQHQETTRRTHEQSSSSSWRECHQTSQKREESRSQVASQSQVERHSSSSARQEKTSATGSQSERRDQSRVHAQIQELRQVKEYYSVIEEQVITAQRLQTLPNRSALVLRQGKGEPRVDEIRSLDMPLEWVTRAGALDGMAQLERWCTPQGSEQEPALNLLDRLRLRVPASTEEL